MAGSPLLGRIRNRAERLRQHRWRAAAYRSSQRHVILGGAPRSGTTILRTLLDRHPEVCCGPETKLLVPAAFNLDWLSRAYAIPPAELAAMRHGSRSQGAFVDAFAARVRSDTGKARWAEKTPQNIRHLAWILQRFPEASVVHIVRDARDVVCSMREHPDWRWVDGAWQKELVPRPLGWYVERWLDDTAAGMAWRSHPRYVELRYEDLVADPARVLGGLCERLGISADPPWLAEAAQGPPEAAQRPTEAAQRRSGATDEPTQADLGQTGGAALGPIEAGAGPPGGPGPGGDGRPGPGRDGRPDYGGAVSGASVGRWRSDLSDDELREVETRCGERLRELGYAT